MNLNGRSYALFQSLLAQEASLGLRAVTLSCGTQLLDFGVEASGSAEAGLALARICLADLAEVAVVPAPHDWVVPQAIEVKTELPLAACLGAQYAGWPVQVGNYFAMGSGPMRAARGREPLLSKIGVAETAEVAVGCLETSELPDDEVCRAMAAACGVEPDHLALCVARTKSLAGTVQIVARSVETALHKWGELGQDLTLIKRGVGLAPLPPLAAKDRIALGRTNDAMLYGAQVTLELQGTRTTLAALGERLPSSQSPDFGEPFLTIFERAGGDFYKIDPLLFSPAQVTLVDGQTGASETFGTLRPDVLRRSFGLEP